MVKTVMKMNFIYLSNIKFLGTASLVNQWLMSGQQQRFAEMRITTHDGKVMNVPVNSIHPRPPRGTGAV